MLKPLITAGILLFAVTANAQNVSMTVTGIRSDKGAIIVSVFRDNQSFKDSKPVTKLKFSKASLAGGSLKISLALAPGTYGIALMDDENGNNKMDNNMIGMPKEGFAFSNFYLSGLSRPSFDDFKFDVKAAPVSLSGKLRYL
jgi:uncharacterized protein (DUF2141 family)